MADFYDISNWQEKPHFQTGGTRNKSIFENPETGELYYFKTSLKKDVADYKHEFWSEILASEIGRELEFDTLKYDIAYHENTIGCLSKSMVDTENDLLSEGVKYLQGYDPNYNPDDKESYDTYTFSFIEKALEEYRLNDQMQYLIKTIIFDSLIGNGDRHQENWAFIVPNINIGANKNQNYVESKREKIKNRMFNSKYSIFFIKIFFRLIELIFFRSFSPRKELNDILSKMKGIYAPIYDSGSCLGRELEDAKVDQMIKDKMMREAYINRDHCEIRWKKDKISHFELLTHIKNETKYSQIVTDEINRVNFLFNAKKIENLIDDIDKNLPKHLFQHKLPENRKLLIKFFVSLRYEKLQSILK